MRHILVTATIIWHLACQTTTTSAVPITGLWNTGLDNIGNYLPTGGSDGNYSVIVSPAGLFTPVAADDTNYPFPPWVPNNPTLSRWIGPKAIYSDGPAGSYVYRTSFSLPPNANPASVVVSGLWGTDDPGIDIIVNSTSSGQVSAGFTSLVPFTLTNGFQTGTNNIDFVLQNAGGPTGLRVDGIRGTYDLVPEPTTLLLAGLGMGGLFMRRRA